MTSRWSAAILLSLCMAACGGDPAEHERAVRIACVGDSITLGIVRSFPDYKPSLLDPLGGYPGRLQRLLGTRAQVLGRGVGGAVTGFWLFPLDQPVGLTLWKALSGGSWPSFHAPEPPPSATDILGGVLLLDRPDVVILLIGINDLRAQAPEGVDLVARTAANLATLRREAAERARTVLVSTLLPQHAQPQEPVDRLNEGIRATYPDYLPLGERFAAAGWERLLGDEIHPNEAGYQVLATTLAEELTRRGLVQPATP